MKMTQRRNAEKRKRYNENRWKNENDTKRFVEKRNSDELVKTKRLKRNGIDTEKKGNERKRKEAKRYRNGKIRNRKKPNSNEVNVQPKSKKDDINSAKNETVKTKRHGNEQQRIRKAKEYNETVQRNGTTKR